ncbi:hypothetical protein MMC31_002166, partial [Peltigera leucophlebia]|nr:hypothetical protein [Peltigera leucophlebia]
STFHNGKSSTTPEETRGRLKKSPQKAAEESPDGNKLQRRTRRALISCHGNLYGKDGFMINDENNKRFCNVCEIRFTDTNPPSAYCTCPANVCKSCRVGQVFLEIENHEHTMGNYSFCRVQMAFLHLVPPTWSNRLHLSPRLEAPSWEYLAQLSCAVGNTVRTVFQGANGEPEYITHTIASRLTWEGTESEETANRLRSGGGSTIS